MSFQTSRLVALFAVAFVISQANLGYILGPLSPNIVQVQLTFDSQAFWLALVQWGVATGLSMLILVLGMQRLVQFR